VLYARQVTLPAALELRALVEGAADMDTMMKRHDDFVEHLADRALLPLAVWI
jgi:N-acetylmuramoyl-L-alanine amidase